MNLPCEDNDIFGWLSGESDDVLIGCFKLHGFLNRSPEAAMAKTHPWTLRNQFFPAHIVCLEEGKQVTMLKRHLRTAHGLIPEQYRPKWGLPARYPIVAPNYTKVRSRLAKESGLGRNGRRSK